MAGELPGVHMSKCGLTGVETGQYYFGWCWGRSMCWCITLMPNLKRIIILQFQMYFPTGNHRKWSDLWHSPLAISAFLWEFILFLEHIYAFCWWIEESFLIFFFFLLIRKFMLRITFHLSLTHTHTPNLIGQFTPWAIPVNLVYYFVITTLKAKII